MNYINRLIYKARQATHHAGVQLIVNIIIYRENIGKFEVSGTLWDGVQGSGGERFYSEHDTVDEAKAFCDMLSMKHPMADVKTLVVSAAE